MKSPLISNFISKVSKLNNSMCFQLFLNEEISTQVSEATEKEKTYLDEFYSCNRYGKMNHVSLSDSMQLFDRHRDDFYVSVLIRLHAYIDYYIEGLTEFLQSVNSTDFTINKGESHLDFLVRCSKSTVNIDIEIVLTLDYIRLRRNRLIHDDGTTSSRITSIYRNKNRQLANYWNTTLRKSRSSFKIVELDKFEFDELIFFIELARYSCRTIDEQIVSTMKIEQMYEYVYNNLFHGNKNNKDVTLLRKARRFMESNIGILPDESIMANIIGMEI